MSLAPNDFPDIDMLGRDERASEAKGLMENALLQAILHEMEAQAMNALITSPPGSPAAIAHHQRLMAVKEFWANLQRLVDDPKVLRSAAERRRRLST